MSAGKDGFTHMGPQCSQGGNARFSESSQMGGCLEVGRRKLFPGESLHACRSQVLRRTGWCGGNERE